ncbi:MAG: folylpolyglutamate synthase/dihydrofolate synthase family protein [Bacteroidota bacterium]
MTYQTTLDYLFSRLPMYQRKGKVAYKKDLTNIHALLDALGRPEKKLKCIHVGGTNGKGSVCHLMAAALGADGSRIGMYTSPHYLDFRERIKIGRELVSEQWVIDFVASNQALIEEVQPSFFEITVAMAFQYFAEQEVDWAVIEVGLGGRLDSTNVIDPVLSIITNISFDHMQFLGDTLPKIASEKAGIIKPHRPVVIGETHPETREVFRKKAALENAPIRFADQLWTVTFQADEGSHTVYTIEQSGIPFRLKLPVQITGPYQAYNVLTSLAALHELAAIQAIDLRYELLSQAWAELSDRTYFLGRWQRLGTNPLVLVDSAHNEAGIHAVMNRIRSLPVEKIRLVLGFADDKDLEKILPLFPVEADYYWVKADLPRAKKSEIIQTSAGGFGLQGQAFDRVADGWEFALEQAGPKDLVYGGGSIFVVAEILEKYVS